jgi:hypothetical protein
LLDIGGRVGALVVYGDPDDEDLEVFLCPVGAPAHPSHNVVRRRRLGSSVTFAAVFPALDEGEYLVLPGSTALDGEPVVVVGGRVTETDHPARAAPATSPMVHLHPKERNERDVGSDLRPGPADRDLDHGGRPLRGCGHPEAGP